MALVLTLHRGAICIGQSCGLEPPIGLHNHLTRKRRPPGQAIRGPSYAQLKHYYHLQPSGFLRVSFFFSCGAGGVLFGFGAKVEGAEVGVLRFEVVHHCADDLEGFGTGGAGITGGLFVTHGFVLGGVGIFFGDLVYFFPEGFGIHHSGFVLG